MSCGDGHDPETVTVTHHPFPDTNNIISVLLAQQPMCGGEVELELAGVW